MSKPSHQASIVIVTPALADANNGNWQTARRWARMLASSYRVQVVAHWDGANADLMIALHARRSAASVANWRNQPGRKPLLLVMTGTDLYVDIAHDAAAQASLAAADALLLLNELGAQALPQAWRAKAHISLQSCPARRPVKKTARHLRALMVGHLRAVKSPQTYFDAARALRDRPDILLDHIGAAHEPQLGAQAQALMRDCPNYRWLGALPHAEVRRRIQAAHLLVHPSQLEGGAHVVIEAITSGTALLASRVDGNVGLLGADHPGLFNWGEPQALAGLILRTRDDAAMLPSLMRHGADRAALFQPEREQARLHGLLRRLLA